ncbi:MAG TPA: alpha/beta fold hydrolase [Holophagaceae bacterium]|nr:alpha/beta fold hydrolase [Holophagaceae bacterium]
MNATLAELAPLRLECGAELPLRIAFRRMGSGPARVLLLHALTGGPDAADREGVKGWWAPLFKDGAPLAHARCTVWTPNLLGSCYGSTGPADQSPFPAITPRDQAAALLAWIEAEDLRFDAVVGGSLGGMVALELALLAPERVGRVGAIGCGGRSDAWVRGQDFVQRRILESGLPDAEAVALARHAAMLGFRSPKGLNWRFSHGSRKGGVEAWLEHHGRDLAGRFSRGSYLALLGAMDAHDLGRERGGLLQALRGLKVPLHLLGIDSDTLFTPSLLFELAHAAEAEGRKAHLSWIRSPHGHDAFLIEWDQVSAWLKHDLLKDLP